MTSCNEISTVMNMLQCNRILSINSKHSAQIPRVGVIKIKEPILKYLLGRKEMLSALRKIHQVFCTILDLFTKEVGEKLGFICLCAICQNSSLAEFFLIHAYFIFNSRIQAM